MLSSYNYDPTWNFFHTYGFVDDSNPNKDEEIIFQPAEVTRDPHKVQLLREWYTINQHYLPRDILNINREDGASLELQKAAYIAICTEEEFNSDQTKYFLKGEISKVKPFEADLIQRINQHIINMICNRRDALQDYLSKPNYQTNEMTRALYRMQSEFLLEMYRDNRGGKGYWDVRTDIYDSMSEESDWDAEHEYMLSNYGLNPNIQFQTQRIIPTMSMEDLYIDECSL